MYRLNLFKLKPSSLSPALFVFSFLLFCSSAFAQSTFYQQLNNKNQSQSNQSTVKSTYPPSTQSPQIGFGPPHYQQVPSQQMRSQQQDAQKKETQKKENKSFYQQMNSNPPTAAQQGLETKPNVAKQAWAMKNYADLNTLRQKGIVLHHQEPLHPVSQDKDLKGWLANWEYALTRSGVSLRKIKFEESRLNQKEFSHWASRHWRFENHINK